MTSPWDTGQRACVPKAAPKGHAAVCSSGAAEIKQLFFRWDQSGGPGAGAGVKAERALQAPLPGCSRLRPPRPGPACPEHGGQLHNTLTPATWAQWLWEGSQHPNPCETVAPSTPRTPLPRRRWPQRVPGGQPAQAGARHAATQLRASFTGAESRVGTAPARQPAGARQRGAGGQWDSGLTCWGGGAGRGGWGGAWGGLEEVAPRMEFQVFQT